MARKNIFVAVGDFVVDNEVIVLHRVLKIVGTNVEIACFARKLWLCVKTAVHEV